MMHHDKQYTVSIVIVATVDISTIYSLSVFNLQRSAASVRLWREGEGRGRGHGHLITLACPSADGVNPPVLTTAITAALDGLAENWVSGIYLSGLSSGPKIVRVTSLIPAILPQCNCPSPPCKRDRELFVAITKKSKKKTKNAATIQRVCGPDISSLLWLFTLLSQKVLLCRLWNGRTPYDAPSYVHVGQDHMVRLSNTG